MTPPVRLAAPVLPPATGPSIAVADPVHVTAARPRAAMTPSHALARLRMLAGAAEAAARALPALIPASRPWESAGRLPLASDLPCAADPLSGAASAALAEVMTSTAASPVAAVAGRSQAAR